MRNTVLERIRMEGRIEAEIRALADFERGLGYNNRDALKRAVDTVRVKYPDIKDSRVFRLAD